MKKFLLGVVLGIIVVLVGVALLFFGIPSERRLSDVHTTGFRMANQDNVLYFSKYLPDTLSPTPFASVVVLDEQLSLVGAAPVPMEILSSSEIIIEADRARRNLQIRSPDSSIALRWSLDEQRFSVITSAANDVLLNDAQLILRSVKPK